MSLFAPKKGSRECPKKPRELRKEEKSEILWLTIEAGLSY